MKESNPIAKKGYKGFNPDWTCRGFQYKVGETYEMPSEDIKMCYKGFHFCESLEQVFEYYDLSPDNHFAEVETFGDSIVLKSEDKMVTNKIRIVREIPFLEIIKNYNLGLHNIGFHNIGRHNLGFANKGEINIGNYNKGAENNGKHNIGQGNLGTNNYGFQNQGNFNSGIKNIGSYNIGIQNHGYQNIGSFNNGNYNIGNSNMGEGNIGDYNIGDYNIGNYNMGSFNIADNAIGYFNTKATNGIFMIFNKPCPSFSEQEYSKMLLNIRRNDSSFIDDDSLSANEKEELLKEILPNYDKQILTLIEDKIHTLNQKIQSLTKKGHENIRDIVNQIDQHDVANVALDIMYQKGIYNKTF